MGKRLNPRHGSMQFWHRVRANRPYARVRSYPESKNANLLGFAGYKAGMTHIMVVDNQKTSMTKGEQISLPVTVIECPPLRLSSIRFHVAHSYGTKILSELFFKTTKELLRKIPASKKLSTEKDIDAVDLTNLNKISVQVYTQPKLTGIGKKTPEIFELQIGGSFEEQIAFVKEHMNKDISVKDVLSAGSYVDARAITVGKGTQGPVKRFGVNLRSHKSEKTIRGPGSLGSWIAQGHTMYRMAFAGQMGYHHRTQYSNYILGIFDEVEKVNPDGGFLRYGNVKTTYVLVKGSVPGPKKRLITLTAPLRNAKPVTLPTIVSISTESKQGN